MAEDLGAIQLCMVLALGLTTVLTREFVRWAQ